MMIYDQSDVKHSLVRSVGKHHVCFEALYAASNMQEVAMFLAVSAGRTSSDRRSGNGRPGLSRAGDIASALLLWPFRAYENRQVLRVMSGMDDHELADIGVLRQDLGDASALPSSSEVGGFLSARANERRRRR